MARGIGLRKDFDAAALRRLASKSQDSGQARRLLALAEIYDGGSRSEAAQLGGVTLQSIRDWVLRFNNHGPEGLIAIKVPGPTPKLDKKQRRARRGQTLQRYGEDQRRGILRQRGLDPHRRRQEPRPLWQPDDRQAQREGRTFLQTGTAGGIEAGGAKTTRPGNAPGPCRSRRIACAYLRARTSIVTW